MTKKRAKKVDDDLLLFQRRKLKSFSIPISTIIKLELISIYFNISQSSMMTDTIEQLWERY